MELYENEYLNYFGTFDYINRHQFININHQNNIIIIRTIKEINLLCIKIFIVKLFFGSLNKIEKLNHSKYLKGN